MILKKSIRYKIYFKSSDYSTRLPARTASCKPQNHMKNFRPHKPTSIEDDIATTLGNLYDRFCNNHYCASCKFFNSMGDCKILFAVQYMQKEIDELKATNVALCNRVAELHDDLNTTAHNMTKEKDQCNK